MIDSNFCFLHSIFQTSSGIILIESGKRYFVQKKRFCVAASHLNPAQQSFQSGIIDHVAVDKYIRHLKERAAALQLASGWLLPQGRR